MIANFKCKKTEDIFNNQYISKFSSIRDVARIKLKLLNAIDSLNDLRSPPGNRLEVLRGDRSGRHSMRINRQWRICFKWKDKDAYDVEIVDYH